MERRDTIGAAPVKVETREEGGQATVTGYAAVYHREDDPGTEYRLWEGAVERISRSAFDRALAEKDDARALFNHDSNFVLGRAASGTLRLSSDDTGLRYDIDLPDTQAARDVAASIQRGDITGSSFAFEVEKASWEEREGGPDVRNIDSVRLFDVGPVTYPAYESSTTGMRSVEAGSAAQAEHKAWRDSLRRGDAKAKRAAAVIIQNSLDAASLEA